MTAPRHSNPAELLATLPDRLRHPVSLWLERFTREHPDAPEQLLPAGQLPQLLRLVACSEFAGNVAIREWEWISAALADDAFSTPPGASDADDSLAAAGGDTERFKAEMRRSRDRHLLHVLWRELNCNVDVWESLAGLSELADRMIRHAIRFSAANVERRFGKVRGNSAQEVPLVVIAMGKLGGHELNFSSDIDLIFLFAEEGESDGERSISANQYFTRMSRQVIGLLDEVTADGFVYRVDTRLRPFGDSGPPVVSFGALESYLLQHGRGWERYAYVKARVVSEGVPAADELMEQTIRPFVYRRYLDYGVFESLREMKALISAEVRRREMASNVKLGPGGIREIEFIVQSLQLVRGGADSLLQTPAMRPALLQLVRSRAISESAAEELAGAYEFLRRLENFLQAMRDQQTHDLPQDGLDKARVALAMGYTGWTELEEQLRRHRDRVSEQFARIAFRSSREAHSESEKVLLPMWAAASGQSDWQSTLEELGYEEAEELACSIVNFSANSVLQRLDAVAARRVATFVPALMLALRDRARANRTLQRVLNVVARILRRSAYVALLNENPGVLERLISVCENSGFLAEEVSRFPMLLDELLDPRLFSADFSADEMTADLDQRLDQLTETDSESKVEVLAQFQRATLFRIAIADFSGSLPIMKVSDRLTQLAEIVMQRALRFAWDDMSEEYGQPGFEVDGDRQAAGFGVIAYGKLGGMELSYRSDLDLVFLHDSRGTRQQTDGEKVLENSRFFGRIVRRLVHFLTIQTGSGAMYDVDTRLRPSGRSGLLVSSMEAFEHYQELNAWTWEHQALLRSRPVAGSAVVARDFERVRSETLRHRVRRESLQNDVCEMRGKMRKQLDTSDAERFDLKQGRGGIGDIEFLVQYLVLENAGSNPALVHYPDNIRQLGTLQSAGVLDAATATRLQDAYRAYRLRLHRLSLDELPPLVPNEEFASEREFVQSIWHGVMTR